MGWIRPSVFEEVRDVYHSERRASSSASSSPTLAAPSSFDFPSTDPSFPLSTIFLIQFFPICNLRSIWRITLALHVEEELGRNCTLLSALLFFLFLNELFGSRSSNSHASTPLVILTLSVFNNRIEWPIFFGEIEKPKELKWFFQQTVLMASRFS